MSPEQLLTLQKLSRLFEQGLAGPVQIKQLSELLASVNHHKDPFDDSYSEFTKNIADQL